MNKFFEKLIPYINLTRLNKPIGIGLLFLPCLFGIALSEKYTIEPNLINIAILFLIGSITMRSAGCIINDILDRNFDKNVERTKARPLALGQVSIRQAIICLVILLSISLAILLQFNHTTIFLGLIVFLLVILYPLTKRFTYYPQIFLGIAFNFGILMSSAAMLGYITSSAITLYISAIFWTLIYDTIYAYQDLEDDVKIGVKSTAVKFGKNPQKILYCFIAAQIFFLILTGILSDLEFNYYLFVLVALCHLVCQVKKCDFSDQKNCLKKFKSNFWLGLIILAALIAG